MNKEFRLKIYYIILLVYIISEAFEYMAECLNLRHMKKYGLSIPPEFEGQIDIDLLKKTQDYEAEKTRFSFISSALGNIAAILFFFGGLLDIYNSWVASLNLTFIFSGWLFFMFLSFAGELLSMPFSLYNTFRIENKYGFNTMTFRLWISDFIKSIIISTITLSLVIITGLYIIQSSPQYWWLMIWGFLLIFGIFMMYISPYVIEPLFNKFTPVDDEPLKERIINLTEKAGIHASRILKIDASKRSRHTNAYFTGIGKTKRIVLFDTLLHGMNHDEIISVLAHEIGHWKRKHLLKTLLSLEAFSFVSLYISYRLIQSDLLARLFHITNETIFVKFVIIAFLYGIISIAFKPVMNIFSRRHEREADRTSFELTGSADNMVSALVKLSRENLSNLYPHPLYIILYYSHPPVVERIRYIKGLQGQH